MIVDDCVVDAEHRAGWFDALRDVDTTWVRVDCPVDVVTQREQDRGDRLVGLAERQARHIHDGIAYDLAVDTSTATAGELAATIVEAWASRVLKNPPDAPSRRQ